jgi:hypothetical protein
VDVLVNGEPLPPGVGVRVENALNHWPHAYWTRRFIDATGLFSTQITTGPVSLGTRIEVDGKVVHVETEEPQTRTV